jgi:ABC-type phosphate transport system substrate-binding protein
MSKMMKFSGTFALGLALGLAITPAPAFAGELLVIAHASNEASTLDKGAIKAHFLKQKGEWGDGNKVRPADQDSDLKGNFVSKVLGMTSTDYERYWLERKYAAAEAPPKKVDDDEAMLKYVGASRGAIGYIDADSLGDNKKVKVLLRISY